MSHTCHIGDAMLSASSPWPCTAAMHADQAHRMVREEVKRDEADKSTIAQRRQRLARAFVVLGRMRLDQRDRARRAMVIALKAEMTVEAAIVKRELAVELAA